MLTFRKAAALALAQPVVAAYFPTIFYGRSLHVFARTPDTDYEEVTIEDDATVVALKEVLIAKYKLALPRYSVRLFLEVDGSPPMTLDSRKRLSELGVEKGSSVLLEIMNPPQSVQQSSRDQQVIRALTTHITRMDATPVSLAQLGHTFSDKLSMQGDEVQEPELPGAAAVLTKEQLEQLRIVSSREAEEGVVAFMTPVLAQYIQEVWDPHSSSFTAPTLVNSECFPWLVPPAAPHLLTLRYKPDLFLTWLPFAELRKGQRGQGQGKGHHFGCLAGKGVLQQAGCVSVVLEAKRGALTRSHFGDLVAYHQALPGKCWGLLFGPQHFWMYTSFSGLPMALRKDAWGAGGSAARLRHFLAEAAAHPPPPLQQLLHRLLTDLGLQPLHLPRGPGMQGTGCYLGSGASGHVFAATRTGPAADGGGGSSQAQPVALKVVLAHAEKAGGRPTPSIGSAACIELSREFQTLCSLARRGAPVVPPLPGSLRIYGQQQQEEEEEEKEERRQGSTGSSSVRGGGYAMTSVCTPAAVDSLQRCKLAFAALAALHGHGVAHGDARLANLMELPPQGQPASPPPAGAAASRLAWIDVRTALTGGDRRSGCSDAEEEVRLSLPLHQLQGVDALTLARSVLRVGVEDSMPAAVMEAASRWDARSTASVEALAEAVWWQCGSA